MFKVYILQSEKTGRYYVGHTEDLRKRLYQHNHGAVRSTKAGRPWAVVYTEDYNNKNDAYRRELQIKFYKGGAAFKNLIKRAGTEAVKRDRL